MRERTVRERQERTAARPRLVSAEPRKHRWARRGQGGGGAVVSAEGTELVEPGAFRCAPETVREALLRPREGVLKHLQGGSCVPENTAVASGPHSPANEGLVVFAPTFTSLTSLAWVTQSLRRRHFHAGTCPGETRQGRPASSRHPTPEGHSRSAESERSVTGCSPTQVRRNVPGCSFPEHARYV